MNIKDLYKELKKEFKGQNDLAVFYAMTGKKYQAQKNKLLIIGRANNGWNRGFDNLEDDHFNWVKNRNGVLSNGDGYNLNSKPFWGIAARISEGINPGNDEKWVDDIAWSNLYKVVPATEGNPSDEMCRKQGKICQQILKEEINSFRPDYIVLITGFEDWFRNDDPDFDFSSIFNDVKKITGQKIVSGKATFNYNDGSQAKVLITERPESASHKGVDWETMTSEILKYLS